MGKINIKLKLFSNLVFQGLRLVQFLGKDFLKLKVFFPVFLTSTFDNQLKEYLSTPDKINRFRIFSNLAVGFLLYKKAFLNEKISVSINSLCYGVDLILSTAAP